MGVVGDAAAVVAGCIAAHVGGGGGVRCSAGTWPPVQEGKIGDTNSDSVRPGTYLSAWLTALSSVQA